MTPTTARASECQFEKSGLLAEREFSGIEKGFFPRSKKIPPTQNLNFKKSLLCRKYQEQDDTL